MVKSFLLKLISFYQSTISPDHSHNNGLPTVGCRFYPSCSEYAKLSIQKYPLYKALPKTLYRILRCNPFSKGGIDNP